MISLTPSNNLLNEESSHINRLNSGLECPFFTPVRTRASVLSDSRVEKNNVRDLPIGELSESSSDHPMPTPLSSQTKSTKRKSTKPGKPPEAIRLRGVRQNNLKGFDLDVPLGQLIVVTGLSGAGKSSLVFETLHAEGQRRYVETFSPYTRQFLEMLDRPKVDSIENIRPSIAIQQSNTVKTSRSTVGTMTELCDYFKVWFGHQSELFDPETGERVEDDNPDTIWRKAFTSRRDQIGLICFSITKPDNLTWRQVLSPISAQGYNRILIDDEVVRLSEISVPDIKAKQFYVVADRIKIAEGDRMRFKEAATQCLHFGQGEMAVLVEKDKVKKGESKFEVDAYSSGLHSPKSGRHFKPATPALFSFNSPVGACPKCRGFGRVIEIDYRLVIPDETLSVKDGAIKPFQGQVYSESLRDLVKAAKRHKIKLDVPWRDMPEKDKRFVLEGEPNYGKGGKEWPKAWYGIRRFFAWLESNTYKMHVRVFLSKFRSYGTCPDCKGARLQPDALNWKWQGRTLPELYQMPVGDLYTLLRENITKTNNHQSDLAAKAILTRLDYLVQVGLDYLTLDRTSRTLSGGEVERVNLTACLGTSLTDTLFVLDEPSIGLHSRDIGRLIALLKRLTSQGNTVVVVEHDESVMQAADYLIEIGPEPGRAGGNIVFQGKTDEILKAKSSLTGAYLSGRDSIPTPKQRRSTNKTPHLHIKSATHNNLQKLSLKIPLEKLVCLSGVSGSGKSTLLENVIHQGVLQQRGRSVESPATIKSIKSDLNFSDIVRVDQGPVTKTPRSNAALYCEAWDDIRTLFAKTDEARSAGLTASHFSFNSGDGRCDHCGGLGFERVEMQFLSDVYVPCPVCEGRRFKDDILAITYDGKSVADILAMDVTLAVDFFSKNAKIKHKLQTLQEVGLGYLPLGQPLNTLSGGESQRLKLVKYLARIDDDDAGALILLDEPTTGLHRDDVKRLIAVLQRLTDLGHSLIVIEHQLDVLKCADWIIELGPGAGAKGGRMVFEGTPENLAKIKAESSPYLEEALQEKAAFQSKLIEVDFQNDALIAAEPAAAFRSKSKRASTHLSPATSLQVTGAREHNLRNVSVEIPHREISVVTGVSGSGKSSLAFDIVFAEGQRRFMESMSSYARQFVEQLPRPDVDELNGIPPTVAIEQRVTRGSRKSTVATVTEVAQYLRLLYAKIGIPHSPVSGRALVSRTDAQIEKSITERLNKRTELYLCAPIVRSRKGHHQPLADWAIDHDYSMLRIDGELIALDSFEKLDRYREHDIELVVATLKDGDSVLHGKPAKGKAKRTALRQAVTNALRIGKGSCLLLSTKGKVVAWFSTSRADPDTGESMPELDPKHFSWNSPKGWCTTCRGYGTLYKWMEEREDFAHLEDIEDGAPCPDCHGARLNPTSSAVQLPLTEKAVSSLRKKAALPKKVNGISLPQLLALPPTEVLKTLTQLKLDKRGKLIAAEIIPEVEERLKFLGQVGLSYLSLDRASATLSGGEAQRIRLAAQLGSNLSGVLYVLDEPSIGLHARDNAALIESLKALRDKSNTLLIVEHDDETMMAADRIVDLGPGAGIHGGEVLANGTWDSICKNPDSLTGEYLSKGMPHPLRGERRTLPSKWTPRSKAKDWLVLKKPALRNLKGDDFHLPLKRLNVVCGISGAGKSTLIRDMLKPAVTDAIKGKQEKLSGSGKHFGELRNGNVFRQCVEVDQEPIGKTPRSTPATYIGAYDIIREVFANLPEAKMRGFSPGTFSFNTKGGRCETCKGAGRIKLEMNFLPDTYTDCEDCGGSRYGSELTDIRWNGKNIADVLKMSFEEAAEFFDFHSRLKDMLGLMVETGLGYLTLGQSSPTLSGGEAQRLKLVSELAKGLPSFKEKSRGILRHNLYLLEEPTIGLHLSDCRRLIELLHRLVDQGHTVVVIEHHLDVIAEADYLVEVGPEGGEAGGHILFQGEPIGILKNNASPSAPFLKDKLKGG
ncbi:excinuclease ABC subunit UvrA [Rubellicoccus peritrichatus]|uniref:UvrABC system protein A n=1 Tax=Rubellicoccus peritrichatus TaxID=3080537 RepID=A0AAQ3QXP3_9BACT|nr:excinuclease ABC subunit UvrA [Puniceicoccus sp. CR14]WOO43065.1 excinuclease ABC subunit UvrA [Puniceicoccus sp. CR14]